MIIDTIEHDFDKLIYYFNIVKWLEIERIKETEIKLQKIKLSLTIADATKKSVISEKCLHHILRQRGRKCW